MAARKRDRARRACIDGYLDRQRYVTAGKTTMTTATLLKVVRDPRSGEVHLPHEQVVIMSVMRNLDRKLFNVKWQFGGDCVVFPEDVEQNQSTLIA
jgi:hypothetical protein